MSALPPASRLAKLRLVSPAKSDPIFGSRPRHELEFLPAALEVVETPPPPLPRLAMLTVAALLFTTLAWACLGRVDVVSTAPGKLIPPGGGKVVQPLEVGTITEIKVHDGQRVRRGDVLVTLEPTETRSDRDRLTGELAASNLDVARLRSQETGKAFVAPASADGATASLAAYQAQAEQAEVTAKLAELDREVDAHRAELIGARAELARMEALLPIAQRSMSVYKTLHDEGYGSTLQLLGAQAKAEDLSGQAEVQRRKLPQLGAQIAAIERERDRTRAEASKTNLAALSEAQVKAASLGQELNKAQERLSTRTLRAPVDGAVQELAIHTILGVVQPGQTLMRIAPRGSGVEVEARLENKDVGFVRPGMEAQVKVETFPFTRYGTVPAKVVTVSQDAVSEKRPDGDEPLYYLVRLVLDREVMIVDGRAERLTPGMAITAEIKTGRRRVIDYVFSPLAKAVREAGRER